MQEPPTKRFMMVRYVALGHNGGSHSGGTGGSTQVCMGAWPKLSRYKAVACVSVAVISVLLLLLAVVRGGYHAGVPPYFADGDGEMRPDTHGPGARHDDGRMCTLRMPPEDVVLQSGEFAKESGQGLMEALQPDKPLTANNARVPDEQVKSVSGSSERVKNSTKTGQRLHERRFPSAIVIGARKAGTRAVLRFVNLHPDVATCKYEPHFFDREYSRGMEWYRHQMPLSLPTQLTIEKTPNYLVDWDAPERVYNFNSSVKLILIVRNPIARAVSDYVQLKEVYFTQKAQHEEKGNRANPNSRFPSFEELAVDRYGDVDKSYAPIRRSLYIRHLDRWLNYFNMSQILVIDGDNIRYKPWEEMAKVEKFLGLTHQIREDCFVFNKTRGFFCMKVIGHENGKEVTLHKCLSETKGRPHPPMDPDVKLKLQSFFGPFNRRFYQRVGRTFDWD